MRSFRNRVAYAVLTAGLMVPRLAGAWQAHLATTYGSEALAVAFGPSGSVVVGGVTNRGGDQGFAIVLKLASDGTELWRRGVDPYGSQTRRIFVDAAGDVLVAGLAGGTDESNLGHFTAVKLDGATGAELWRHEPLDSFGGEIFIDAAGNVVASIAILVNEGGPDADIGMICRKLASADGSVLWESGDCATVGAVDAAGDLYVGSYGLLRKLSGEDGHELWRATPVIVQPTPFQGTPQMTVDAAGDLVLAQGPGVAKFSGQNGALSWTRVIAGLGSPFFGEIKDVATDTNGDVVVGGGTSYVPNKGNDFFVSKLAGTNGRRLWHRRINGRNRDYRGGIEYAIGVGLDAAGDVVAAGQVDRGFGQSETGVFKLSAKRGKVLWVRQPQGGGGYCRALAVDPLGVSVVAGSSGLAEEVGADPFFALRLEPNGDGVSPILVR